MDSMASIMKMYTQTAPEALANFALSMHFPKGEDGKPDTQGFQFLRNLPTKITGHECEPDGLFLMQNEKGTYCLIALEMDATTGPRQPPRITPAYLSQAVDELEAELNVDFHDIMVLPVVLRLFAER